MNHIVKIIFASLTCIFFSITALPSVQAAPQTTMQVNAEILNSYFWDSTFVKESFPSKPSSINVEWSFGINGSNSKEVIIIPAGKTSGKVNIESAKGEIVNINVCVKNAKNETLGKWSIQVPNKGQDESVTISIPDKVEPLFEMIKN